MQLRFGQLICSYILPNQTCSDRTVSVKDLDGMNDTRQSERKVTATIQGVSELPAGITVPIVVSIEEGNTSFHKDGKAHSGGYLQVNAWLLPTSTEGTPNREKTALKKYPCLATASVHKEFADGDVQADQEKVNQPKTLFLKVQDGLQPATLTTLMEKVGAKAPDAAKILLQDLRKLVLQGIEHLSGQHPKIYVPPGLQHPKVTFRLAPSPPQSKEAST